MIQAEVTRNGQLILQRTYRELDLTLAVVLLRLEDYVKREGLNQEGDCLLRVRFESLSKTS